MKNEVIEIIRLLLKGVNNKKYEKDFNLIYKNLCKKNGIVLINNVTMKEI